MFAEWRRVRAEVSHDWIERGLVSQLEDPTSDPAVLRRRSRLCWHWWEGEIRPRLEALLETFPLPVLPGLLVAKYAAAATQTALDDRVLGPEGHGSKLTTLLGDVKTAAATLEAQLDEFAREPNDATRAQALRDSLALLGSVRRLPRGIVMP